MSQFPNQCDVIIVGGGLVGSALAVALRQLNLSTLIVESHDTSELEQPSFDARVTALANGSRRILDGLGLWAPIAAHAEAITNIHISERGQFGTAQIQASDEGVDALGFTIENRLLGQALWADLNNSPDTHIAAPANFTAMNHVSDGIDATVATKTQEIRVRAKLVVAADGARSSVRRLLGLADSLDDYEQFAVIFNCEPERALNGLAYERFTPDGPIAVLPLEGQRASVVWTIPEQQLEAALAASDGDIRAMLADTFGSRLGPIGRLGRRYSHRLSRVRAKQIVATRVALLGSAAVNLHPVAGQGFNLALRDVAALAETLADELRVNGSNADIGDRSLLDRYAQWRRQDHRAIAGLTHGLVRLFGLSLPGLPPLRGLGLAAFDVLPGAKALFANRTMGRTARMPRLAIGRQLIE